MNALKINTTTQKIEVIVINSWRDIAPAIGNECDTFACPVTLKDNNTLYVDDEGLFHPFDGAFIMEDWDYPIVGNGIVMGCNKKGNSIDVTITKEELEEMIIWIDINTAKRYVNNIL